MMVPSAGQQRHLFTHYNRQREACFCFFLTSFKHLNQSSNLCGQTDVHVASAPQPMLKRWEGLRTMLTYMYTRRYNAMIASSPAL